MRRETLNRKNLTLAEAFRTLRDSLEGLARRNPQLVTEEMLSALYGYFKNPNSGVNLHPGGLATRGRGRLPNGPFSELIRSLRQLGKLADKATSEELDTLRAVGRNWVASVEGIRKKSLKQVQKSAKVEKRNLILIRIGGFINFVASEFGIEDRPASGTVSGGAIASLWDNETYFGLEDSDSVDLEERKDIFLSKNEMDNMRAIINYLKSVVLPILQNPEQVTDELLLKSARACLAPTGLIGMLRLEAPIDLSVACSGSGEAKASSPSTLYQSTLLGIAHLFNTSVVKNGNRAIDEEDRKMQNFYYAWTKFYYNQAVGGDLPPRAIASLAKKVFGILSLLSKRSNSELCPLVTSKYTFVRDVVNKCRESAESGACGQDLQMRLKWLAEKGEGYCDMADRDHVEPDGDGGRWADAQQDKLLGALQLKRSSPTQCSFGLGVDRIFGFESSKLEMDGSVCGSLGESKDCAASARKRPFEVLADLEFGGCEAACGSKGSSAEEVNFDFARLIPGFAATNFLVTDIATPQKNPRLSLVEGLCSPAVGRRRISDTTAVREVGGVSRSSYELKECSVALRRLSDSEISNPASVSRF